MTVWDRRGSTPTPTGSAATAPTRRSCTRSTATLRWGAVGLAFFVGNDFGNNLERSYSILTKTYHKPYFVLEGGELALRNVPVPPEESNPVFSLLREHSSGYRFLKERIAPNMQGIYRRMVAGNTPTVSVALDLPDDEQSRAAVRLTRELLRHADRELRLRGTEFFLIVIPTLQQLQSPAEYRSLYVLDEIAEEEGIPVIDLYHRFRDLSPDPAADFYISSDGHWSAEGHRAVAAEIIGFLRESGLVAMPEGRLYAGPVQQQGS